VISIISNDLKNDYIYITDIAKFKNLASPADVIKNCLRLKETITFLGIWEKINNPRSNSTSLKMMMVVMHSLCHHKNGYQKLAR